MDYFNDVRTTFLDLEGGSCVASMERQKAFGFHQKYLNLCSKMNKGLMGLEQHKGELLMTIPWIIECNSF